MIPRQLVSFLNAHVAVGINGCANSLEAILANPKISVAARNEALITIRDYLRTVSGHAMEYTVIDMWKNSTDLPEQAALRAQDLEYPDFSKEAAFGARDAENSNRGNIKLT